jgi:hypothetical protein
MRVSPLDLSFVEVDLEGNMHPLRLTGPEYIKQIVC